MPNGTIPFAIQETFNAINIYQNRETFRMLHFKLIACSVARQPDPRLGPRITLIAGGTGNADVVRELLVRLTWNLGLNITVSDNGGSSRPIREVLGGPAMGDFRAILVRLAQANLTGSLHPEIKPVLDLLQYRLPKNRSAYLEWQSILNQDHALWRSIPRDVAPIILADLRYFGWKISQTVQTFEYQGASVGNFFLTGARERLQSLESAIHLFKSVLDIPYETRLFPAIASDKPFNIGACLTNHEVIYGQNEISHPGSFVDKQTTQSLRAPIDHIFYYDEFHQVIDPPANALLLDYMRGAVVIGYATGSFWTSIMPTRILAGVESVISAADVPKVLMLPGWPDREIQGADASMLIAKLQGSASRPYDMVTHLFYVDRTTVPLALSKVRAMGVVPVPIPAAPESASDKPRYDAVAVVSAMENLLR